MTTEPGSATTSGEPRTMKVRKISLRAYQEAMRAARLEPRQNAQPPRSRTDGRDQDLWDELEQATLAERGALTTAWQGALAAAGQAPVQIRVVARYGHVSFSTDVVLLPGLGLATTQRALLEDSSEGLSVGGREPAVEIVAFPPQQLWSAVRRVLPPHEALRADARPTPPSSRRTVNVPNHVRERLTELAGEPLERSAGDLLSDLLADDEEWAPILRGGDAEVALLVGVHAPDGRIATIGMHRWILTDEHLYVLEGGSTMVVAVEAGAIAHELTYLVTGAYSVAASLIESEGS